MSLWQDRHAQEMWGTEQTLDTVGADDGSYLCC